MIIYPFTCFEPQNAAHIMDSPCQRHTVARHESAAVEAHRDRRADEGGPGLVEALQRAGGVLVPLLAAQLQALHQLAPHGLQELPGRRLLAAPRRRQAHVQRHARVQLRLRAQASSGCSPADECRRREEVEGETALPTPGWVAARHGYRVDMNPALLQGVDADKSMRRMRATYAALAADCARTSSL